MYNAIKKLEKQKNNMLEKKMTQKDKAIATIEIAKHMKHKLKVYKRKDAGKGYEALIFNNTSAVGTNVVLRHTIN